MGKKVNWSWTSAFIGAASATAVAALITAKPKDPTFHLISIKLTSFKLKFPVIDADLILTVHVTNPNVTPINYSPTSMSIFYEGSLLGAARVEAGSQPARSCQLLKLPTRLDGMELAHHAAKFFSDVGKREMLLNAKVDIGGKAKVLWWGHRFKVHVDSSVTVDPVFLDVIDQETATKVQNPRVFSTFWNPRGTPSNSKPNPPILYANNPNPNKKIILYLSPKSMGKEVNWSWTSAFIGAASATAVAALVTAKPKDPIFRLISIKLTSFKLKFPVVDADLILTVHVTNPNVAPIQYSPTTMSIFYEGSLLGSAPVEAGSQPARSCQVLTLTARLDGMELAHHAAKFFSDVAKREMLLNAKVDIGGEAKVLWWGHRFMVHVDSSVTVDPVFLDVIDQESSSELDLLLA